MVTNNPDLNVRYDLEKASQFLPEINYSRCLLARFEISSCDNCIAACPHEAWVLTDESLALDTKNCTGCALCVGACNEVAIEYDFKPILKSHEQYDLGLFACDKVDKSLLEPSIPCVHALSLLEVLELYHKGVRVLITVTGECGTCVYNHKQNLKTTLKHVNQILDSRGWRKIKLLEEEPQKFNRWLSSLSAYSPNDDRRGFLLNMLSAGASAATPAEIKNNQQSHRLVLENLVPKPLENKNHAAYLFVPLIDLKACNSCEGCIKACPHQVFNFNIRQYKLEFMADSCTGCDLCVDICEEDAITVTQSQALDKEAPQFKQKMCKICGVGFRSFGYKNVDEQYCHICSAKNNNHNLYQILN